MALLLELRPDTENLLRYEAKRKGTTSEAYAKLLVEEGLPAHSGLAASAVDEDHLLDELATFGRHLPTRPL